MDNYIVHLYNFLLYNYLMATLCIALNIFHKKYLLALAYLEILVCI